MNILVVDHDVSVIASIMASIKGWNHNGDASYTGKDALEKFRQKKFDLVMLDIFLPDCKGQDLIPKFKELFHNIGIVTMTDYNSRELELEVRKQGIIYYMIKPVDTKDLKGLLDHISKKSLRHNN